MCVRTQSVPVGAFLSVTLWRPNGFHPGGPPYREQVVSHRHFSKAQSVSEESPTMTEPGGAAVRFISVASNLLQLRTGWLTSE